MMLLRQCSLIFRTQRRELFIHNFPEFAPLFDTQVSLAPTPPVTDIKLVKKNYATTIMSPINLRKKPKSHRKQFGDKIAQML